MAKYLITGIAGFIGSSLALALTERGEEVRGVDNFVTGRRENLKDLLNKIDLIELDLCDAAAMQQACNGVDYVLHNGALPSVQFSIREPEVTHQCNVNGTFNVLNAARAAGVKRLIYAGSSSAYGDPLAKVSRESARPIPMSPYAVQKLCGEYYASNYWHVYGLETVSLRYFNIFGPRQSADSPYSGVIARFIHQMLRWERPTIYGTGQQTRDFTYVDNVVDANLSACIAPAENVAGKVFNIGCGGQHTLNQIYEFLAKYIGFNQHPVYEPPREGEALHSQADISAATDAFSYRPNVSLEEGLKRTVDWYSETLGLPLAREISAVSGGL